MHCRTLKVTPKKNRYSNLQIVIANATELSGIVPDIVLSVPWYLYLARLFLSTQLPAGLVIGDRGKMTVISDTHPTAQSSGPDKYHTQQQKQTGETGPGHAPRTNSKKNLTSSLPPRLISFSFLKHGVSSNPHRVPPHSVRRHFVIKVAHLVPVLSTQMRQLCLCPSFTSVASALGA